MLVMSECLLWEAVGQSLLFIFHLLFDYFVFNCYLSSYMVLYLAMSTRNLKQLKLQQFFFLEYILVEVFEQSNMIAYDAMAFEFKTFSLPVKSPNTV